MIIIYNSYLLMKENKKRIIEHEISSSVRIEIVFNCNAQFFISKFWV